MPKNIRDLDAITQLKIQMFKEWLRAESLVSRKVRALQQVTIPTEDLDSYVIITDEMTREQEVKDEERAQRLRRR